MKLLLSKLWMFIGKFGELVLQLGWKGCCESMPLIMGVSFWL